MKKIFFLFIAFANMINFANAQWQQTNLDSGYISCFAINETNIFAGGDGVYLSTDNGANWTAVNNGLPNTTVRSLAISGTNIFAATGNLITGEGVYLSTDNGANWTSVNNGLQSDYSANSLAISDTNIFVGIQDHGIYLSTDNGASWSNVGLGGNCPMTLAINNTNILAGTWINGVYLSTDNGANWTAVNNGLPNTEYIWSLAISGTNIFAGTCSYGVYLSTNNGSSWAEVNNGLPLNCNVMSLTISGTNIFAGTYYSVYLSTNNGSNWTAVNDGLPDTTIILSLAIIGTDIFAGTYNSGVWKRPLSEIVSIKEISGNNEICIYPNPTNDKINIAISQSISLQNNVVSVYNIQGQLLLQQLLKQEITELDISRLAKGVYVLRLSNEKEVYTEKIIKE